MTDPIKVALAEAGEAARKAMIKPGCCMEGTGCEMPPCHCSVVAAAAAIAAFLDAIWPASEGMNVAALADEVRQAARVGATLSPGHTRRRGAIMTDAKGWPDPSRPGVPLHPDKYRAHCVQFRENDPVFALWLVIPQLWLLPDTHLRPPEEVAQWRYLGACFTPQEVAKRHAIGIKSP